MTGSARGRALWSLADQVTVSIRSFLLLIVVIRTASPATVGAFGIVYTTFFLLLAVIRGFGGDTLVVRATGVERAEFDHSVRGSSGAVLILGLLLGLVLVGAGLALGGALGTGLWVLGVLLVPLVLQDHLRLALFAALRPRTALVNDVVALVLQAAATGVLLAVDRASMGPTMTAWGLSAGAAALLGIAQLGVLPDPRHAWSWVRRHTDLGPAFAADALANRGAEQLANIGVGLVASLSSVGALTASRTLFAPLTTVQSGLNAFLMPEVARRTRHPEAGPVGRLVTVASLGLGAGMFVVGILLWLVPVSWGELVLGDNWRLARTVLIPMATFSAVNAVSFGYWGALKALGRGRTVLLIRAIGGVGLVLGATLGAWRAGAPGAAWGMAVATTGTAAWMAGAFHRHDAARAQAVG